MFCSFFVCYLFACCCIEKSNKAHSLWKHKLDWQLFHIKTLFSYLFFLGTETKTEF